MLAVLDAVEWQTTLDFETGKETTVKSDLAAMAQELLKRHRYPGDMDLESISWVTNVALDLYQNYAPQFMFLSFSQPYFFSAFERTDGVQWQVLVSLLFARINHFIEATGMTPVVVGTGQMVPLKGYINLSTLDGLASGGGMAPRFTGLYKPSARDLELVRAHENIELVKTKEEVIELFGNNEDFVKRLPDYVLGAGEGYAFKAFGSIARPMHKIPGRNMEIPVFTPLGEVNSITEIAPLVLKNLETKKMVLIVLEGIGPEDFLMPYSACDNSLGWYDYAPGDGQYLTIGSGRHLADHSYLPGFKYYLEDDENKKYPLSAYFTKYVPIMIGHSFPGKSAAVGSRSVLTHMASGADISVECFARGLYNYGTIAIIKD
ncbi:MAG: hypothetical protein WBK48_07495 [Dethiobacteria bacterium]|jgi:hypothetical protein|nr:hypothetical protein [Bacillota bacterium]